MFEAVADFIKVMIGLYQKIREGMALGELLSDPDSGNAFMNVAKAAHLGAWADIINNGGLNNGQLSMATMAQGAGGEYLKGINFSEWNADDYIEAMRSLIDGFDAISIVADQAAMAVNHAVTSSYTGTNSWLSNFSNFEGVL